MSSNLARRVAFAAVAIPAVAAIVWLGGWPLAALLAAAGGLGAREVADLAERGGVRIFRAFAVVTAIALPAALAAALFNGSFNALLHEWWPLAGIGWVMIAMIAALARRRPAERPLAAAAITSFAVIYTSALPSTLYIIRHAVEPLRSWTGTALVFFPLIVVWISDTAAMFAGMAIGGPKLAPVVSPHKTQSGAVAGVVAGALAGAAFAELVFRPLHIAIAVPAAAMLAVIVSAAGLVGDLAESLFKREAAVKDSSALIPGHGGVLDRLDALYFAIPVAAAGYRLLGLL